jgi:hypothetical protein
LQACGPQRKRLLQGFSPAVGERRSQALSLHVWASKIKLKHQTAKYTLGGKNPYESSTCTKLLRRSSSH